MGTRGIYLLAIVFSLAFILPSFDATVAVPQEQKSLNAQPNNQNSSEFLIIRMLPSLDSRKEFHGGSVISIRVVVLDGSGNGIQDSDVTIWVDGAPGTSPGNSFSGNTMRHSGDAVYQFNLDTKPYPSGAGSDPVEIDVKAVAPDGRTGVLAFMINFR